MKSRFHLTSVALACIFTTCGAAAAYAQAKEPGSSKEVESLIKALKEQSARLNAQEQKLAAQEKAMDEQRRALMQERERFDRLSSQVATITGKPVETIAPPPAAAARPAGAPASDRTTPVAARTAPEEVGTDRKQNPDRPPEIAAVIEEGGVLLRKGNIVLTPSFEYTRSSATRVSIDGFSIIPAVNIGLFEISKVNRDTLTAALGLRYGVTNRFEIEAKVPYVYRNDATTTRPIGVPGALDTLSNVSSHDMGDIEVGAHYQINKGENGWPFLIGNLRFKTATGTSPFEVPVVAGVQQELPTGSGFYALQPSVTAIYPSDPVVFYSNVGYLYNFERSFPTYGNIKPGDSVSASFGMSLSLNDKASMSLGYSHSTVFKTQQNGSSIPNSSWLQVGSLDLGYAYNLSKGVNLNFTVGAGLTSDAPDARLIFRVPISFDSF